MLGGDALCDTDLSALMAFHRERGGLVTISLFEVEDPSEYGIVEVDNLQTNGVQLWMSVTNIPGTTNVIVSSNSCLFANLIDATGELIDLLQERQIVQGLPRRPLQRVNHHRVLAVGDLHCQVLEKIFRLTL